MATWVSSGCVLALLVVLAIVSLDRNRLRHRMDNAEGAVTGLTADLQATQELLRQLQSYLGTHESWQLDAVAPTRLTANADRWSPPVAEPAQPPARTDAGSPDRRAQPSAAPPRPTPDRPPLS